MAKLTLLPDECRDCEFRFACHGGCPKDRFVPAESGPPRNYLCRGYKAFFRHVDAPMRAMCELLRAGRQPAAIMKSYKRAAGRGGMPG
jgi:uncharacterized protein